MLATGVASVVAVLEGASVELAAEVWLKGVVDGRRKVLVPPLDRGLSKDVSKCLDQQSKRGNLKE